MKKKYPIFPFVAVFMLGYSVATLLANHKHQEEYSRMQKIQQDMAEALKLCTK